MKTRSRWHEMARIAASNTAVHCLTELLLRDPGMEWDEFLYRCVESLAEENESLRETVVRLMEQQSISILVVNAQELSREMQKKLRGYRRLI